MRQPFAVLAAALLFAPLALAQGEAPKPSPSAPPAAPATKPAAPPAPAAPDDNAKPISSTTTPSGILIEELRIGDGLECKPNTILITNYRGMLKSDGTEFYSTYKLGKPDRFRLARLAKGWQEGVPGMKVGGKRRLTIPAALGYGSKDYKDNNGKVLIPANSDLIFEIELLDTIGIEDLKVGDGEPVYPGATVTVTFTCTLKSDGRVVETSTTPTAYNLVSVNEGWTYGLPGMKVGGKRKLIVPWPFAFGEQGSPPKIPPKADLIYEIELVNVSNIMGPPK